MVELIFKMVALVISAIFRFLWFLLMLMFTGVAALFVGVNASIDRIASSWIEQSSGNGVLIGYDPVSREGIKILARLLLVVGWCLDFYAIYLIMSLISQAH